MTLRRPISCGTLRRYSAYLVTALAGIGQPEGGAGYRHIELRPSAAYALHGASSTLALPHGDVELRWERSGGVQLDKVAEDDVATLDCGPRGGAIARVAFASFGTPAVGGAGGGANGLVEDPLQWTLAAGGAEVPPLRAHPACHARTSEDVIAARCLGRSSCRVPARRADFGFGEADVARCEAVAGDGPNDKWAEPLRLWAVVECEKPDALDAHARVPIGSTASAVLPLRGMQRPVLRDGSRVLYGAGAPPTVGGAAALSGGGAQAVAVRRVLDAQLGGEEALVLELGSGAYALSLEEA